MRSKEESLEQLTIIGQRGSKLVTHARSCKTIGSQFDQFRLTGNIAACRSNTAAGILDERACHYIGSYLYRLTGIGKFSVAVIYEADNLRVCLVDNGTDPLNIRKGGLFPHC